MKEKHGNVICAKNISEILLLTIAKNVILMHAQNVMPTDDESYLTGMT